MVWANTKMGSRGAQQAEHGHKHTCMAGEISRKYIHDVGVHGGTRMVADELGWVRISGRGAFRCGGAPMRHVGTQKVVLDHEFDTTEQASSCVSVWARDRQQREKENIKNVRHQVAMTASP